MITRISIVTKISTGRKKVSRISFCNFITTKLQQKNPAEINSVILALGSPFFQRSVSRQNYSKKLTWELIRKFWTGNLQPKKGLRTELGNFFGDNRTFYFESFRGLQLQLSGLFRMNWHYSYSCLVFLAEIIPSGTFKNYMQLQLHDLMVFECEM